MPSPPYEPSREVLLQLLELQKVDSTIARLEGRRSNLPEQAELERLEESLRVAEKELAEQQAIVDEIASRQKKFDGDIELISAKIASEDVKLYSGSVASAKELAALQSEIGSLKRRKSTLEDMDLEVMEEREAAEQVQEELSTRVAEARAAVEGAVVVRDVAAGDLAKDLEEALEQRREWAPRIDPPMMEFYEELKAVREGLAVVALIGGTCQGCHIRLPAQEYERVRHSEVIAYCDECRRVLVVI